MGVYGCDMRSSDTAMDVESLLEEMTAKEERELTITEALMAGIKLDQHNRLATLAVAAWLLDDGGYRAADFSEEEKGVVLGAIEEELQWARLDTFQDSQERKYELERFQAIFKGENPALTVYAPLVELQIKLRQDYYRSNEHVTLVVTKDVNAEVAQRFLDAAIALAHEILSQEPSSRERVRQERAERLKAEAQKQSELMQGQPEPQAIKGLPDFPEADTTEKPVSGRRAIANEIARFILDNHLCQVYGGDVTQRDEKGKPYAIGFSRNRFLDGEVVVYGPKFILIKYQTGFRALPPNDEGVFTSKEDALKFLQLAFVEKGRGDDAKHEAMKIPRKQKPKA